MGYHIVFDAFPGPDAPRFIEVENDAGESISVGEWRRRTDGMVELLIDQAPPPESHLLVTAEEHNAAFDPANEALGGAFMAGFREGWIYAEIDADGERYQEMAEEYSLAVDTAPGEAWDAHRAKFFAMLPLAAIPAMGTPIADKEAEIARVVQSVNEWDDRTSPDEYPDHLLITSEELADILRNFAEVIAPAPQPNLVACPCTTFEQDEDCHVGYPSLLCAACDGKGIAPIEKVVAFAAEMMKVAEQVDELEDPFAAWETIDLIKSQHGQLRAALKPFAAAPYTGPNSFNRAALSDDDFRQARHVLAITEGSDNG